MQNCSVIKNLILRRYFSARNYTETYYDILNVHKDCNSKDIRSAYVDLTKKFHPDVSGIASNAKFIKILEAYNVLSKPHLRAEYDRQLLLKLGQPHTASYGKRTTEIHKPWEIKPDINPNPGAYYGVKGLGRMSNIKLAAALIVLGIFLSVVGFSSIRRSFAQNQLELDKKSAEASSHHANIRASAERYGNEEQLKRMVDRMLSQETGASIKPSTK